MTPLLSIICWTKDQRADDQQFECVACKAICYNRTEIEYVRKFVRAVCYKCFLKGVE